MTRKPIDVLLVIISVAVCAAISCGVFRAASWAVVQAISPSSPYCVLVHGLFGMWSVVLFGFLIEEAERIAERVNHGMRQGHPVSS